MTRKLAWVGFSYMAGLFLASVLGKTVSVSAAAVLIAGAAVLIILRKKRALESETVSGIVCCICIAAGLAVFSAYDTFVYEKMLSFNGTETAFYGKIISEESVSGGKTSFTAKGKINGKYPAGIILVSDSVKARIGDEISFSGKGSVFNDSYVFDTEKYYKAKGIYLSFYNAENVRICRKSFSVRRLADNCKNILIEKIEDNMPEEESSLMKAMLLGDRNDMENSLRTSLYRSGIGHIMAVSGIHMTIVYSFISLILLRIGRFSKRTVFIISILTVGFFCVMTGLSVSAVRAFVMLFILGIGDCIGRESDTLNSLGIAGLILTVKCPFAIADTGLILSFAGVIGAGVIAPCVVDEINRKLSCGGEVRRKRLGRVSSDFIVSLCAYSTTLPVTVILFDEVSVISPITNVLLVPLCTLALIVGAVFSLTGGILPILPVCTILCKPVIFISDLISKNPPLFIPAGSTAAKCISVGICALIFAVMFFSRDILKAASAGIFCSFITASLAFLRIIFMPEIISAAYVHGGGSAAAIISNGRQAAVIDMGGGYRAADKYLKENGIYNVDMILLTENTSSAAVSYNEYLKYTRISSFFVYEENLLPDGDDYSDKTVVISSGEIYDGGFYRFWMDEDKGINVLIKDRLFYIPSEKETEKEAYAVFLEGRGNYKADGAEIIVTDGRGNYDSDTALIYDDVSVKFILTDEEVKRKVMFVGGN